MKLKSVLKEPLQEAEYKLYHQSFTSASQAAYDLAKKKGYTIDEDDWFSAVSTGKSRGRPSVGKTNSFHVDLEKNGKKQRQQLHFQVFGMQSGTYELNAYVS